MALFERFIYFGCKTVALLVDEMLLPLLKDFATAAIQIGHSSFVACVDGGEDGLTQEHLLQYDTVFDRLRGDGIAKALVRMLQNPALLPLDAAVGACHPNSDCMGSFGILIETVLTSIGALTVLRAEPASMEGSSSNMDPMQLSAMYAMFASCDRRNIGALSPAEVTQVGGTRGTGRCAQEWCMVASALLRWPEGSARRRLGGACPGSAKGS